MTQCKVSGREATCRSCLGSWLGSRSYGPQEPHHGCRRLTNDCLGVSQQPHSARPYAGQLQMRCQSPRRGLQRLVQTPY